MAVLAIARLALFEASLGLGLPSLPPAKLSWKPWSFSFNWA